MLCFVGGDLGFVLQAQAYIVKSFQQTVPNKIVYIEACREALTICNGLLLKVDC